MEDLYINDSLSQNISAFGNTTEAGKKYYVMPSNNPYVPTNAMLNPITDPIYKNNNNNNNNNVSVDNNITQDMNVSVDTNNESREADISIFANLENNVPDFFVNNISEEVFIIFIATAALLASARINNKLISFILFVIISLLVSLEYGVSIAIVFYAIFFVDTMDIFIIILVVLALIHIFLPIPGLVSDTFNWNYVIQAVLGLLLLLSINNNWKRVFCIDNSLKNSNTKIFKDENTNGILTNMSY
ncbi:putative glycerol uptake facilitator [Betaentomopoxvirus amoorei]|uniref:AMV157 n=1 Tax=Amsacta moorei entomopoxvirus TaxID=28321 RepID=Q9EMP2_AMEPV|nr:putative glycerol uptake facilitator [Amsacta moorei entomopoxvirus]AAG02863.1 AMV157 [Amsacta moorei entomopoxvirus]